MLIDSLRNGWRLPPTEEEMIEEEKRKIEGVGEAERKKREKEIEKAEEDRKEYEKLEAKFRKLSKKKQKALLTFEWVNDI